MDLLLVPHPETPSQAASAVDVMIDPAGDGHLLLRYTVTGDVGRVTIPAAAARPARRDGLWKTTCFELFLRDNPGDRYVEVNLSPSGDWAAYRLAGYRAPLIPALIRAPSIRTERENGRLVVHAVMQIGKAVDPAADWSLGLSAVIEEEGGVKSYWALTHPPGAPDFHHRDCFALNLPASAR